MVVRPEGFEPPTRGLEESRSFPLSVLLSGQLDDLPGPLGPRWVRRAFCCGLVRGVQPLGQMLQPTLEQVGVDLQRHARVRMPQVLLNLLRTGALVGQDRGAVV